MSAGDGSDGDGVVLSWTRVHRAPSGVRTPFVLVLVETAHGLVLARLSEDREEEVEVGDVVALGRGAPGAPPVASKR